MNLGRRLRSLSATWRKRLWSRALVVLPGREGLKRPIPVSRVWGLDRGRSIDRYYVEAFLARNAKDIQGRVLEIKDDVYTLAYGTDVTRSDVLDVDEAAPGTTIVADLTSADHIDSDLFDCVIFTQTLQYIFDPAAAIRTLHRILKPDGVLLATFPGISQTPGVELRDFGWRFYWRFTRMSAERMFGDVFSSENVALRTYGNVLSATAFLYGIAAEELDGRDLDRHDPEYEVAITVRAVKRGNAVDARSSGGGVATGPSSG
jgi:SAM-dependent methyltransferase